MPRQGWVSALPETWAALPLKAIATYSVSNVDKITSENELPVRLCNYTDVYKHEFITTEMDLMSATATAEEIARFQLRTGDVVITKDSESWDDIAVPALVTRTSDDLVCGYHLAIIRPSKDVMTGRFLLRCLQARVIRLQLELAATGVTRFGLSLDDIGRVVLPVPPLPAQQWIADFLDHETATIDTLVAEKKRALELLQERRAALVGQVMTHGAELGIPTRASNLGWLGVIPVHWQIQRLKLFCTIGNGSTPDRENPSFWEGGEYPWLNSSVVNSRPVREVSRYVTETALRECHLPKIEPPAVLVAITGQGKTRGRTTVLLFEATINQHLAYLKPYAEAADCSYLSFMLDSAYIYLRSVSDGAGSTRGAITTEDLGNFAVPLPPLAEQRDILADIKERLHTFTESELPIRRSLDLLAQRRQALIGEAVTGRIPVEAIAA